MNFDAETLIRLLVALTGIVLTFFLIPWLKTKTTAEQRDSVAATVKTLVRAAEQLFGPGTGEIKLSYVAEALAKRGIVIDLEDTADSVRAMIEEAVLCLSE